jgi:hypothetical protein
MGDMQDERGQGRQEGGKTRQEIEVRQDTQEMETGLREKRQEKRIFIREKNDASGKTIRCRRRDEDYVSGRITCERGKVLPRD